MVHAGTSAMREHIAGPRSIRQAQQARHRLGVVGANRHGPGRWGGNHARVLVLPDSLFFALSALQAPVFAVVANRLGRMAELLVLVVAVLEPVQLAGFNKLLRDVFREC